MTTGLCKIIYKVTMATFAVIIKATVPRNTI